MPHLLSQCIKLSKEYNRYGTFCLQVYKTFLNSNIFNCNHDRSNTMAGKLFFVPNHPLKLFCLSGVYNKEWNRDGAWERVTRKTKTQNELLFTQIFVQLSCFVNTKFSNAIDIRAFSTKFIFTLYSYLWYDMIWYDTIRYDMVWYIFVNCKWVATRWQLYNTHLHTNSTQNDSKQTIHRTTQNLRIQKFWNSAGLVPTWRVIPWHSPYNWGKSTEKLQSG